PDGKVIRTARRARKSAAGYDLTRLMIGAEGTLGIITEITLRLHGIPEAISSAVCSFETLKGAVDTVVQSIQIGVPVARIEILDDAQVRACNA
ncbi:FAD-binding oxidoreductase, partial [Klebsiella pneumoniae]|uniref:FAD-linked oxidase C-terminal domain-containing protein n=2 Tax=Pseudomonadota TaxID=1224 RepID=UPI00272E9723